MFQAGVVLVQTDSSQGEYCRCVEGEWTEDPGGVDNTGSSSHLQSRGPYSDTGH